MFSVIIPVYNKAPHLQRSIGSVLNQTFRDFELILVDDCSTDGSTEIIESYKDERISIVKRHSPGPGGYAARNLGASMANKPWVAFLDADDAWIPERLEKMCQLIQDFPGANYLSSGWREYSSENSIRLDFYYQNYHFRGSHYIDINIFLSEKQPICTSVAVIKRDLYNQTGGFNEKFRKGGDIEFWFRIFLRGGKGAWLNELTATYYKDSVNMVTKNELSIEIPVFDTLKHEIQICKDLELKAYLISYKNRIVYLKSKNLILMRKKFRKYNFIEFNFFINKNSKILLANLMILFLPIQLSRYLIRKYIL